MPSKSLAALLPVSQRNPESVPDLVYSGALVRGTCGHAYKPEDSLDAAGTLVAMYYSLANADGTMVSLLAKRFIP